MCSGLKALTNERATMEALREAAVDYEEGAEAEEETGGVDYDPDEEPSQAELDRAFDSNREELEALQGHHNRELVNEQWVKQSTLKVSIPAMGKAGDVVLV